MVAHWLADLDGSSLAVEVPASSANLGAGYDCLGVALAMVNRIDQALFGGEMPTFDKDRIRSYLLPNPPSTIRQRDAIGLAIGSPGFQWY